MKTKQENLTQQITYYSSLLKKLKRDIQQLDEEESIIGYLNHIEINLVNHLTYNISSQRKQINTVDFLTHFNELFSKISFENLLPIAKPLAIFHSSEYVPENYDVEIAIPLQKPQIKQKCLIPVFAQWLRLLVLTKNYLLFIQSYTFGLKKITIN